MHLNSADTHCVTVPVLGKCPARNKMVVSYTGLKAIDFPSNTGYETIYRDRKQYSGWCRNRETNEWDTWLPFSICKKQKKKIVSSITAVPNCIQGSVLLTHHEASLFTQKRTIFKPLRNVAAKWLQLLLRLGEVPRSHLGPQTGYPNWCSSWFLPVSPWKFRRSTLNEATTVPFHVLPNSSIIPSINSTQPEIMTASLNKPQIYVHARTVSAKPRINCWI
jgi:hypothetical protein